MPDFERPDLNRRRPPKRRESENDGIDFKPITKGLGFHPFSDGLPYAPLSRTQKHSKGTGAVSAGPPKIAVPRKAAASAPAEIPLPTVERQALRRPAPAATAAPENPVQESAPQEAARPAIEQHFGFLYLFKRALAYFVDTGLNLSLTVGGLGVALWKLEVDIVRIATPELVVAGALFLVLFNWALITAQEIAFGSSVGKRLFALSLPNAGAAAIFVRAFFFLISVGFAGLGLLWALIDKRRRCWHDLLVDLQPLEIARL